MTILDYKPIFKMLDKIIAENNLGEFYKSFPRNTPDEIITYYASICQNELLYLYHIGKHDGLAEKWYTNYPDAKTCGNTIITFYTTYTGDGKELIDSGLESRKKRRLQQTGFRYIKMKNYFKTMFPDMVCFCCKSRQNIQIDHITSHNSFKNIKLAYDINNLQYLCASCNQRKGNKIEDYRSEEQKKHVKAFIQNFLDGENIIS